MRPLCGNFWGAFGYVESPEDLGQPCGALEALASLGEPWRALGNPRQPWDALGSSREPWGALGALGSPPHPTVNSSSG